MKSKLDIEQVISEYIQLKKAGIRFTGLCPFHSEKTPSFSVSPDMQFWYCFGCNEGGDVISFVMRMEGMDFSEALQMLAKKAGVQLDSYDERTSSEKQRFIQINTWAAKFFHEVLLKSPQAELARAYVEQRGLADETVEDLMIGYSPDSWDATMGFLRKKGFRDEEIFKAGLAVKKERGTGYFDRFRGRLMFPIRDVHGNVVAFTGRIMPKADGSEDNEAAKYVNTQQTLVYNKSAILFGLDKARQAIRKEGLAVVVEGNMDVIASHQADIRNVVASSGTALTSEQLDILKRYTNRLVLSFDADEAGERAARRGIELAVAKGFTVRILRLPPDAGKDPDDCIRKDVELWKKAIDGAIPFMEWYIALAKERTDFSDPDAKKEAAGALIREVSKLPDSVERAHWVRELSEIFQTPEPDIFNEVENARRGMSAARRQKDAPPPPAPKAVRGREELLSEHVAGALFAWPELADVAEKAGAGRFLHPEFRELYSNFVLFYNEQQETGGENTRNVLRDFVDRGNQNAAEAVAISKMRAEREFGELPEDERKSTLVNIIGELKLLHKNRLQRQLATAMSQAEKAGDMEKIQEIQQQLKELMSAERHG